MSTHPYYSCDPGEPEVYHDYRQCPLGRSIPLLCRRRGTKGLSRCPYCASMDRAQALPVEADAA